MVALIVAGVVFALWYMWRGELSGGSASSQAAEIARTERVQFANQIRRLSSLRPARREDLRSRPASDRQPRNGEDAPLDIPASDYIAYLRSEGETEGLAAFNPPGTNPPKAGVIVPDDYELPEGYARHFQSTDDGQRLEPILALSPLYDLFDADGRRINLPHDRVVPPELAPPDLPLRILEVPQAGGLGLR